MVLEKRQGWHVWLKFGTKWYRGLRLYETEEAARRRMNDLIKIGACSVNEIYIKHNSEN